MNPLYGEKISPAHINQLCRLRRAMHRQVPNPVWRCYTFLADAETTDQDPRIQLRRALVARHNSSASSG